MKSISTKGNDVATTQYIFEMTANGYSNKDFGYEQQRNEQKNELDSVGFNANWEVTDTFGLSLDYANSQAKSLPNDPVTGGKCHGIQLRRCTPVLRNGSGARQHRRSGGALCWLRCPGIRLLG